MSKQKKDDLSPEEREAERKERKREQQRQREQIALRKRRRARGLDRAHDREYAPLTEKERRTLKGSPKKEKQPRRKPEPSEE